jgi:hypothetical protein
MKNKELTKRFMVCYDVPNGHYCSTFSSSSLLHAVSTIPSCVMNANNFRLVDVDQDICYDKERLAMVVIQKSLVAEVVTDQSRLN